MKRPRSSPPDVDPDRLRATVRALAVDFSPRDIEHPRNLDAAARHIRGKLEAAGLTVDEQPYEIGARTYRNIVATLGPPSSEIVVVGAHYDVCMPFPGADDNASGVAGLVELARHLVNEPLGCQVQLVAYTLEEPPVFASPQMGSAVHARSLAAAGVTVRAMLALEMLGCFSDEEGSQRFPVSAMRLIYPTRGNFIGVVGRVADAILTWRVKRAMAAATPLPVHALNGPRLIAGVDYSDHRSYWDQGWPAVMITDTAFYRNPRYHTPDDTPDTLDYARMAQVVQGTHAAVLALCR